MIHQACTVVMSALGATDPKDHVLPHGIFPIFSNWNIPLPLFDELREFWFTNHLLMTLVAAAVVLAIFVPLGRRYQAAMAGLSVEQSVPRGFAGMIEGLMDALRSGVVKPVLGDHTDRFMPFLWTVFFYILVCNLLGMVPLDSLFFFAGLRHLGGTATGNINVTAGLALCAFVMIHVSGVRQIYEALIAGTFGHHVHGDEEHEHAATGHGASSREHDDRGGGGGEGGDHHAAAARAMSPAPAVIKAVVVYLWNFAPHVFPVPGRHGSPGLGLRVIMGMVYVPMLFVGYYLLFTLFKAPAGFVTTAAIIGGLLGVVYAALGGGLHPLDLCDAAMWEFLFFLEVIGALVKPFALCMRLFANMIAGHIVLASLILLVPAFALSLGFAATSIPVVIGCVLFSCLELFVAFLQAYIFMFLTTMFINTAVNPEH